MTTHDAPPKKTRKKTTPGRRRTDAPAPTRRVFVTGFPGFIGRRLVTKMLADEPRTSVVALVEERYLEDARKVLAALPRSHAERVEVFSGDVTNMDLGLSGEEFQRLSADITDIFHMAAIHKLRIEPGDAERVNVGGTRAVLEFARECPHLERLIHFSSCYVSGDRIGVITEEELSMGQRFRNVYEATKYKAEVLVRAAMTDLPITVVRPSIVVGDSRTGEMDRFDGIYQVGVLVVTSPLGVPLPMPGDGVAPLNMVPVDFVVTATLALSRDPRAVGRTFHLVDPNPLASRSVYELIAQKAGRRVPRLRISTSLTKFLMKMPGLDYLVPQGVQTLHYLNHLAIYNSPNTLELLHGTGIMCPRFENYVDRLVDYVGQRLHQLEGEDPLDQPSHAAHAPT
ncbi:MAG: SDR family oxidoreductase [Myxococcota bacterium]